MTRDQIVETSRIVLIKSGIRYILEQPQEHNAGISKEAIREKTPVAVKIPTLKKANHLK
jgi:hypothetical protein